MLAVPLKNSSIHDNALSSDEIDVVSQYRSRVGQAGPAAAPSNASASNDSP